MMRDASLEHRGDQSYETAVGVTGIGRLAKDVTAAEAAAEARGRLRAPRQSSIRAAMRA